MPRCWVRPGHVADVSYGENARAGRIVALDPRGMRFDADHRQIVGCAVSLIHIISYTLRALDSKLKRWSENCHRVDGLTTSGIPQHGINHRSRSVPWDHSPFTIDALLRVARSITGRRRPDYAVVPSAGHRGPPLNALP
ncbi:hypothetical protein EVAR_40248_1 [Eumeta japonica]|uniref:Uncharacterized protein n=1 Tax=Eumeta variegata TaxID=151549 RepID=A0A4C1Y1M3_EUMVA|nr:hypothetical protein EVAR_40248_1 [Eumeta japonica]